MREDTKSCAVGLFPSLLLVLMLCVIGTEFDFQPNIKLALGSDVLRINMYDQNSAGVLQPCTTKFSWSCYSHFICRRTPSFHVQLEFGLNLTPW